MSGMRVAWRPDRAAGLVAAVAALLLLTMLPVLAQTFPPLSGRVVDAAGILDAPAEAALTEKLAAFEQRSSDQIVVATVPNLGGTSVEDYANRLFREWKLGQEKVNNGILLLVAPNERKVRIEVGYGLEGELTDALSSVIIATAIAPRFKAGDFAGGLTAGVDAIVAVLTGEGAEWRQRAAQAQERDQASEIDPIIVFLIMIVVIFVIMRIMAGRGGGGPHRTRRGRWVAGPAAGWGTGSSGWGGGWSGGSGGGGFSGGGGSSGGGGASGSW
jgi:uncharacterized protein